jgi:hypothetical protein
MPFFVFGFVAVVSPEKESAGARFVALFRFFLKQGQER